MSHLLKASIRLARVSHRCYTKTAVGKIAKDELLNENDLLKAQQAPNRSDIWSVSQNHRADAMTGPRFEQTDIELQPRPLAAIELISQEPVRLVNGGKIWCDGGHAGVGHPKVYLNLESGNPVTCGYCGIRFQMAPTGDH